MASGIILAVAYSQLKTEENPIVEKISGVLPGLNCGACGYASCHEYAVSIAEKEAEINLCRPGGEEVRKEISGLLGVKSQGGAKNYKAVVRCGVKERKKSAIYEGDTDCASMNLTGAGMACRYGCLGGGDCVEACPFGAIELNENKLPVVDYTKCTGCGLCVAACPRDIITLVEPVEDKIVYVGCMSSQSAKDTRAVCDEGCIGCRICERKGPEGAFLVEDNLSSVKEQRGEIDIAGIKCPQNCIDVLKRNG